ncbi:MAG: hypothetical protein DHS20C15_22070 [Planctomycetota bacterium]|nr:MAG: hypothetical protein DHS20C15_22070 [Planctomycetota bacterium]
MLRFALTPVWVATVFLSSSGPLLVACSPTSEPVAAESAAAHAAAPAAVAALAGDLTLTPEMAAAGLKEHDLAGPGDPPVDAANPEGKVSPALGGRAILHIASEPPDLNFMIGNSATVRQVLFETHAALVQFSPITWEHENDLARESWVEDSLFLNDGSRVWGRITEEGDAGFLVESGSPQHEMEPTRVSADDVARVERGTVWTFALRDDVSWHDGHPFDAGDVAFSMDLFGNPHVDCDEKRYKYGDVSTEQLDAHTVRFFRDEQYFGTKASFGLDFCILPSHLYNLADADNAEHDAAADAQRQGEFVNDHPANKAWVGLGPYRVTKWETGQYLEAQRFADYWKKDPAEAGYLDTLRWRFIDNDDSALQALLNEEIDIFTRVKTEDFVGEVTRTELFLRNYYKVLAYVGNLGYTSWNLRRTKFKDLRVRQALAHAFDVRGWIETNYEGLALWSTASTFWFGPGYNHSVENIEYDVEMAEDLLSEAGWYDRNGNGIIDKDGEDFVLEVLMPSGNKASEKFLQAMQEAYKQVGIQVKIQGYEWATMLEHLLDRDFDAVNMAWTIPDPESDPKQIWHGSESGIDTRSSNHAGLNDPEVDRLIDAGRRELDPAKRYVIWRQLHERIHSQQPYLFGWTVPRKLAINKKLHGVKIYKFEPGFRLRDLYYAEGTPGTRPLR